MAGNVERERRFLVVELSILRGSVGSQIVQGYLFSTDGYVVRIRRTQLRDENDILYDGPVMLTAKGPRIGDARQEVELEIPLDLGLELLARAPLTIRKARHQLISEGLTWDIDVFESDNEGLIIAEYEGDDVALLRKPWWAGQEVTGDAAYNNENLAAEPFKTWDISG